MSQPDSNAEARVPDVYDLVEYPAFAYQNTHPGKLAAMAILHGLQPAPVTGCRVLEIGCNAAANLIPMAYALPGSEFVGFDLAAAPIAYGQKRIDELGLTNIRVLQADLMKTEGLAELEGKFDYIIAHGVYAWVPPAVRERLLVFIREHLSERGVAFTSYAALPGGNLLLLARDIMSFCNINAENPAQSVMESIEFLRFIANCRPVGDGFRVLLERHLDVISKRGPEGTFHDELASGYQPVLFSRFTQHAAQYGLNYFGEAQFPGPKDPCHQQEIMVPIGKMAAGNHLVQEQILDFARMRQYRESLLCHAEQRFTYDISTDSLQLLHMSSTAESSEGRVAETRVFTAAIGARIETQHAATILVMEHLIARFPASVAYTELAAMIGPADASASLELPVLMLRLITARMVELEAWEPPVAREIPERPLASKLCRQDVLKSEKLVTLLHTTLEITDPVARKLIPLLDGTRDRAAILADLQNALPEMPAESLAEGLEPALQQLQRTGIFESR